MPPPVDPYLGKLIEGRFQVLGRIAGGGMGVVYRAVQQPLDRPIALKVLRAQGDGALEASFRERFILEAAAVSKLNHPNTLTVHDYGCAEDGTYFIAMELLEGRTLKDAVKKNGPLSPKVAIHVGIQIASSLDDAHAAGLVHRDLKPGNVMLIARGHDPYFVKVLDFGLVKLVGGDEKGVSELTRSGVALGSPHYMAPEQILGGEIDGRTDVYSFGAMMYYALVGVPPFAKADSNFEALAAHVSSKPPRFKELWKSCEAPEELEALVMRCLAKEPADRYPSMNALRRALRKLGQKLRGHAPETLPPEDELLEDSGEYVDLAPPSVQTSLEEVDDEAREEALREADAEAVAAKAAKADPRPAAAKKAARTEEPTDQVVLPEHREGTPVTPPKKKSGLLRSPLFAAFVAILLCAVGAYAGLHLGLGAHTGAGSAASAQGHRVVSLSTDPEGARVTADGVDLGDTPVAIPLEGGRSRTVHVAHEGYEPRDVLVHGHQPELRVRLRPITPP